MDRVELSYSRPYTARANESHLWFSAPDDGALGYSVTVPNTGWPLVCAVRRCVSASGSESQQQQTVNGAAVRQVRFAAALDGAINSAAPIHYWVSGKGGLLSVEGLTMKSIATPASLLSQAAGAAITTGGAPGVYRR